MEAMVDFWKGKKVFITGHTGFKGSWLSLWLQHMGAHCAGYALAPPTEVNLFQEAHVAENMQDIRGDVRDFQALHSAIQAFQPDVIFHLAAQPLVRYSYSFPIETYETNVMGTVYLLEAARQCPSVKAIVNVTTDKCYDNREWHWGYREGEPLGGHDPYSNSKACSELVTSAYRHSFFQTKTESGLASARAGNVIGGGDWAQDRLLPDLIAACIANEVVKIRYPNSIRPWQHVLEPLAGYLRLAQLLFDKPHEFSDAWNFGPADEDAKPVSSIADEVLSLWKYPKKWELADGAHFHEATYLKLDCSKARNRLLWVPQWNLSEALHATVSWYKAYYRGEDARAISLQQINNYMNLNLKGKKHETELLECSVR